MRGNIGFRDRIMQAPMSGKITRVAAILSAAHRRGYGVRRLTAFLEDAIRANRVRYSQPKLPIQPAGKRQPNNPTHARHNADANNPNTLSHSHTHAPHPPTGHT